MADCGLGDFDCYSKEIASTVWTRTREALQNDVNEWVAEQLSTLGTMWVDVPTPDLGTTGAPAGSAVAAPTGDVETHLTTVLGYVSWISGTVAVIGLVILAVMVGLRIRSGDGIPFHGKLIAVLAGGVLIAGSSSLVSALIPTAPAASTNTATFLQSSTWWLAGVCAIVSVMIGGARMAWEQRARPGQELLKSLLTLVIVASAGLTIVWLLVRAGDSFSTWIIDESLDCDLDSTPNCFKDNVGVMLGATGGLAAAAGGGSGAAVASGLGHGLFIGVIVGLVSVVQVLLMIVRGGMLVILAGILPLAASATNTELGKGWFQRCVAWLTAFILYKPAAAIVYAAGFHMSGAAPSTEGSAVLTTYTGLVVLALAIVALPALMRFVTPMVGALASSGGGAAISNSVADRVPDGARPRPGSGPQGSSGSTGAARPGANPAARPPGATAPRPHRAQPAGSASPMAAPSSSASSASAAGAASGGTAATAAAGAGKAVGGPYVAAAIAAVQPLKKGIQYGTDAAIAVAERTTGEDPSGGR
ncbi:hypothetical protein C5B85_14930 [Pseudoclavibacter sp. AY1F1]|uniref:hypothetical protein n=1 Tax=Pseudoclavibacter sp. AY1F1 TaxID=2080583 RepID=UPI000CE92D66|nr:hypothetical protein [Pseudoclavibacter sp. AY1F1]PPF42870.1 hypothetical protein C5B85_14930 [Pseudoclavibacter sp. AY1F1]